MNDKKIVVDHCGQVSVYPDKFNNDIIEAYRRMFIEAYRRGREGV